MFRNETEWLAYGKDVIKMMTAQEMRSKLDRKHHIIEDIEAYQNEAILKMVNTMKISVKDDDLKEIYISLLAEGGFEIKEINQFGKTYIIARF